jgi:GTPase SAR1 family protein
MEVLNNKYDFLFRVYTGSLNEEKWDYYLSFSKYYKYTAVVLEEGIVKLEINMMNDLYFIMTAKNYFRGISGIFLIYDVTNINSFLFIRELYESIIGMDSSLICKVLIGIKCEKSENRKVTYNQGSELARELSMQFYEVSTKLNYNMYESFKIMAKEIIRVNNSIKNYIS